MTDIKVLFVCGKARMRSPTAADIVGAWDGFQSDCAGLSNDADAPISLDAIEWADRIYVMEPRQKKRINTLFGSNLKNTKITCLHIPDKFEYQDDDLVTLLTAKLANLRNAK